MSFDMPLSLRFVGDFLANDIYIKIMIFGISAIKIKAEFIEFDVFRRYLWLRIKGKTVGIALTADTDNQDSVLNYLANPILKFIDFRFFDINIAIGVAKNAFLTAFIVMGIKSLIFSVISVIKCSQTLKTYERFNAVYGNNCVKADFFGIISMTPANIIFSFVYASIDKIKKQIKIRRENSDIKSRTKTNRKSYGHGV